MFRFRSTGISPSHSASSTTSNSSILSLLQAHSQSPSPQAPRNTSAPSTPHSSPTRKTSSTIAISKSTSSVSSAISLGSPSSPRRVSSRPNSPAKATLSSAATEGKSAPQRAVIKETGTKGNSFESQNNKETSTKKKSLASSRSALAASSEMGKKAKLGSTARSTPFTKSSTPNTTSVTEASTSTEAVPADSPCPGTPSGSSSSDSKQNVVVCVRMRPSRSNADKDAPDAVWSCDKTKNQIVPTDQHPAIAKRTTSSERAGASIPTTASTNDLEGEEAASSTYKFQFDKLVMEDETTDVMFDSHIGPVVKAAMEGYNGTVFAYGQTGSGKTHTMSGSPTEPGVIPRAVRQVFKTIEEDTSREFLLRVSYLEIYNETLKDLLAPLPPTGSVSALQTTERPASPVKGGLSHSSGQSQSSTLRIIEDQKQNRVLITGLREEIVTDAETVLDLLTRGQEERHIGATDWNERSSRSHCVFQLTIESRARSDDVESGKEVRVSQLNLIDLAGSERAASQAERRKEGAFINKSLLTLGTVIGKLTEPAEGHFDAHIPYRDSKLTRILQTSLSGNARIAVICTLSPDAEHANETLSTLKFGKRCKLVVTTAKKGTSMDDKALLQKYRKELDALRAKLEANGSTPKPDITLPLATDPALSQESQQKLDQLDQQRQEAEKEMQEMQLKRADLKGQIDHLTKLILTSKSVANEGALTPAPGTPIRRTAHAPALARRGPRMSDLHAFHGLGYNSPVVDSGDSSAPSTLSGIKPFELEAELAALRRQLREQLESRQTLVAAHQAELAARDARQAELQEAIRMNEEELDEAEVAYDKLKEERDEARKIALKEQEKARENRKRLLEEQEANRLLKLVAKARAGEEEEEMQAQIGRFQSKLAAKEAEASAVKAQLETELLQARQALELEKQEKLAVERDLQSAREATEKAVKELEEVRASAETQHSEEKDDQEDVVAEFRDLVSGKSGADGESFLLLKQREESLHEREKELQNLQSELERTRQELGEKERSFKPLPVPSVPAVATSTELVRELQTLKDELSQSEQDKQMLQVQLAKLQALTAGRENDSQRISSLVADLEKANKRIMELERKIEEEKMKATQSTTSPDADNSARIGSSVPSSPLKGFGVSRIRPKSIVDSLPSTPTNAVGGLNRAGSVKEYRRYQPGGEMINSPIPSPSTVGTRSVLLGHRATFDTSRSNLALNNNKAEKEEIERLNAVINSQRALMADLEKSVASWKERMKAQAQLIQKLVSSNGGAGDAHSPPASDGEADAHGGKTALSELSFNEASPRRKVAFESSRSKFSTANIEHAGLASLPRTTHLSLTQNTTNSNQHEPYYGAHTYNRPPPTAGLGVLPGSPQKGFSGAYAMNSWSGASPNPVPLPHSEDSNFSPSPSKRKPRKTIEMDLKLLKSSPRVESNKSKFSLDSPYASQDTPTKRRTNASAYYI